MFVEKYRYYCSNVISSIEFKCKDLANAQNGIIKKNRSNRAVYWLCAAKNIKTW